MSTDGQSVRPTRPRDLAGGIPNEVPDAAADRTTRRAAALPGDRRNDLAAAFHATPSRTDTRKTKRVRLA